MEKFKKYDFIIADPNSSIDIEKYLGIYKDCPFFIEKCENGNVIIEEDYLKAIIPAEAFMLVYDYVFNKYGFSIKDVVYNRETLEEIVILDFEEYFVKFDDTITGIAIIHDDAEKEYSNKISPVEYFITKKEYRNLSIESILSND